MPPLPGSFTSIGSRSTFSASFVKALFAAASFVSSSSSAITPGASFTSVFPSVQSSSTTHFKLSIEMPGGSVMFVRSTLTVRSADSSIFKPAGDCRTFSF